jgi:hypothetical protein
VLWQQFYGVKSGKKLEEVKIFSLKNCLLDYDVHNKNSKGLLVSSSLVDSITVQMLAATL